MEKFKIKKEYHKILYIECLCGKTYKIKKNKLEKFSCSCENYNKFGKRGDKRYTYISSALTRKYPFDLSEEEFLHITSKNCYYCGDEPREYANGIIQNGIDRVDNSEGYNIDNVIACCTKCNLMKGTFDNDVDFKNHAKKIIQNDEKLDELSNTCVISSNLELFKRGFHIPPHIIFLYLHYGLIKESEIKYNITQSLKRYPIFLKDYLDRLREAYKKCNKLIEFNTLSIEEKLKHYKKYCINGVLVVRFGKLGLNLSDVDKINELKTSKELISIYLNKLINHEINKPNS